MPSSEMSVSPVIGKLGLTTVSYTLNTGDLVLKGSASISPATLHREAWSFLMPLLHVGSSVKKSRTIKMLDISDERTDQSMRATLFLLIPVRCVLALSS